MKAEEAYKIAEAQGYIDDLLNLIKAAATRGQTEIVVPQINDFQVQKLVDLGYQVYMDHGPDVFAIVGNRRPDHHKIRWSSDVVNQPKKSVDAWNPLS